LLIGVAFFISETGDPRKVVIRFSSSHFTDTLSRISGQLSRYSVERYIVNYLDILSGVSRSILSIFCRAFHVQLCRYIVCRLTVNYLHILSGP
jgi:hypothetical protein